MRTIRASSLPLALACPASQVPPQTRLADDSPESRLGSATHEVLAEMVRGNGPTSDGIEDAAARWRVEHDELAALCWNGNRAWQLVSGAFPGPRVEHQFIGCETDLMDSLDGMLELTGHIDVYAAADGEFRILDWKTGHADAETEQQMRCYAWLGLRFFQEADRATALVVRLREMTVDKYAWSRRELDAWFQGVVRDTADVDRFRAGRHCSFCSRRNECNSRLNYVVDAVGALVLGQPITRSEQWDDAAMQAYDRLRLVEDACQTAREALRADIAMFGPRHGSDGRTLALVRQECREINAAAAWEILTDRFGDKVLDAAKLSKSAVERLAMDAAPRGTKGVAAKQLIEELDRQGAVTVTTIERLECSRHGTSNCNPIEAGDAAVSRPAIAGGTAAQTGADDA